ncbi:response regulator transcription factor [Desulfovibrio sp. JC010]|nr:response regulator transcription factor [Desulfovibrio sp. JC010]
MEPLKVLVVEDHQDLAENICDYLSALGHVVDYAPDGVVGLHLAVTGNYDALVLDVMMPGLDGINVCARIRESSIVQPAILMLTALDTLQDKLSGFDSGADDYLVKPFALEELSARLDAVTLRRRGRSNPKLTVGQLVLDSGTMSVSRAGKQVKLNRVCFQILKKLMETHPNVLSRSEMEFTVWGEDPPDSDALRSHIYKLRLKVDKNFAYPMIETVHGVGFRLAAEDEI